MNPESSQPPPGEREARLTALLHGELPAAEAEALRAEIAADAGLAALFRRLSLADSLARETVRSPEPKELNKPEPLQVAPERRAALLAKFKSPPATEVHVPSFAQKAWSDRRELLALAAMLVALVTSAGLLLPSLAKAKAKAHRISAVNSANVGELSAQLEREALSDAPANAPALPVPLPVPPAEPALGRRFGIAATEGRKPGEVEPSVEAAGAAVAANAESVAFGIEVKGPTVASAAPAGGVGGRAGGQGVTTWAFDGGVPNTADPRPEATDKSSVGMSPSGDNGGTIRGYANAPANAAPAAPAGVALGFQASLPTDLGSIPESATRQVDPKTETFFRETDRTGDPAERFATAASERRAKAKVSRSFDEPVNAPIELSRGDVELARKPADFFAKNSAGLPGAVAAGKDVDALIVVPNFAGGATEPEALPAKKADAGVRLATPVAADERGVLERRAERPARPAVALPEDLATRDRFAVTQTEAKQERLAEGLQRGEAPGSSHNLDRQEVLAKKLAVLADGSATTGAPVPREEESVAERFGEKLGAENRLLASGTRAMAANSPPQELVERETRLAAVMDLGQQVARSVAAAHDFGTGLATNTAVPVLGDEPVLGQVFKGVEAKERVADPKWIGVLEKDGDRPLPKLAPGAPEPQAEVVTADNAFSTFSLNVSDVSFKLAAAALEKGQMPEPVTVRTEEFINAFDYRDPEPAGAAPIAFAWERARYPFAHDRDLVRFSVKTAASGRQPGRPLNLVLLLDNSGSMERADRVRIRQECLRVLAGQLQPEDRVSVVAFARTPRLWVDGLSGAQAAELPGRVGELTPDGGTNLEEALRTAYQTAARHFAANGVNRVVLLTDGAANLGDVQPDSLKQQVETNRQQGIALDCFGIGWEGFNDELLEVLSRNGDGRYGFVNTPEAAQSEFAGQLVGALQIAASDVKVQVEWNPRRVPAYRQLGYAKHQLKKEQFRDNTVDAAEIGAAEAGNALYTVQVNPAGEGPLGTVRVRFKVPGTGDYREHEWPLHYDGTARPLDQADPALRLAAGASAFSEWLVSSPWAAEVTPDRLLGLLNGVTDAYAADPRPKQFEQMLRQAKSVSGK